MKPVLQMYRHEPHNEIFGDCYRTCLACLLHLESWQVPHFAQIEWTDPACASMDTIAEAWLGERGLAQVVTHYNAVELKELLRYMGNMNPDIYYILSGKSPRGTDHSVIACGGAIVHDPCPDGGGLTGSMSNGTYEVITLTSQRFVRPWQHVRDLPA